MGAPGQITEYINPKIASTADSIQDYTMTFVGGIDRFPASSHLEWVH